MEKTKPSQRWILGGKGRIFVMFAGKRRAPESTEEHHGLTLSKMMGISTMHFHPRCETCVTCWVPVLWCGYTNTNEKTESHSETPMASFIASNYSQKKVFIVAMCLYHVSNLPSTECLSQVIGSFSFVAMVYNVSCKRNAVKYKYRLKEKPWESNSTGAIISHCGGIFSLRLDLLPCVMWKCQPWRVAVNMRKNFANS